VVMIGADSHKRTHTVVALDDIGRRLGELTVAATTDGHLKLLAWSAQWEQVVFALEDCRHLTRRLERDLLGAGARIVRVPTRLMAGARRGGREPGKSDPIDAEAVALAALRHDDLPVAELDGPPARSGCSSIIAATWSPSAPGSRAGCAGTCTNSTPRWPCPAAGCAASASWMHSPRSWRAVRVCSCASPKSSSRAVGS
jgi:hypothetical protein